ncbi:MAG: hypothetical protein H7834_06815 [Magnetococcus sp. YQC-9]
MVVDPSPVLIQNFVVERMCFLSELVHKSLVGDGLFWPCCQQRFCKRRKTSAGTKAARGAFFAKDAKNASFEERAKG